jgi:probable O-glycosylation ligase (exosortase A-associated)
VALRDIILFALIFGLLPVCFLRPYVGLLVYSWLSYMNPHRLTWGAAYDFPFAQLAALAMLAGLAIMVLRDGWPTIPKNLGTLLLALLWLLFLLTTITAIQPQTSWPVFTEVSKIFLITFVTLLLVDSHEKLRLLLLTIALSIGFYGIKGGLFAIRTGGDFMVWGPDGSFIADNTALGLALNMVLPLIYGYATIEKDRRLRFVYYAAAGLTVLGTMFTYSRGAFLGLAVAGSLIFLTMKVKTKVVVAILVLLAAPAVISQLPEQWLDRIVSIQSYEEDGSAQSRFSAWTAAWGLATDRPLTGGGLAITRDLGYMFLNYNLDAVYSPEDSGAEISGVHSVYFALLAENGFITLGVFMLLMAYCFWSLGSVRRQAARQGLEQYAMLGRMLPISIIAFAVSGAFLEFHTFDLYYHLVAASVLTTFLFGRAMKENPGLASEVSVEAASGHPRHAYTYARGTRAR